MNVVVVTAYLRPAARRHEEERALSKFDKMLKARVPPGTKVVHRAQNEVADMLYAPQWHYDDATALTVFDRVDLFIFRGSPTVLPWFKAAKEACLLMAQCLQAAKPVFASSFGSQLAVFGIMNEGKLVEVVNGHGAGSPLSDLPHVPLPEPSAFDSGPRSFQKFLDDASGDLFAYHHPLRLWVPDVNCGFSKPPRATVHGTYKPKKDLRTASAVAYSSTIYDTVAYTEDAHLAAPLLRGLPKDHTVTVRSSWRLKEAVIEDVAGVGTLDVMTRCPRMGPQLFRIGDLTVCWFDVAPESVAARTVFDNYLDGRVRLMKTNPGAPRGLPASLLLAPSADRTLQGSASVAAARRSVPTLAHICPELSSILGAGAGAGAGAGGGVSPTGASAAGSRLSAGDRRDSHKVTRRPVHGFGQRSSSVVAGMPGLAAGDAGPATSPSFLSKWKNARGKLLEEVREVLKFAPRPKIMAMDVVDAFRQGAHKQIAWQEVQASGQPTLSVGRWRTHTVHRSDHTVKPAPTAGSPESLAKLSYTRRTGLGEGKKQPEMLPEQRPDGIPARWSVRPDMTLGMGDRANIRFPSSRLGMLTRRSHAPSTSRSVMVGVRPKGAPSPTRSRSRKASQPTRVMAPTVYTGSPKRSSFPRVASSRDFSPPSAVASPTASAPLFSPIRR